MRLTRIFADVPLGINETLELPEAAAHHIGKVLRMRPDQKLHVFNGRGGYYTAVIAAIDKRTVSIIPLEFHAEERESNLNITLGQGISRGQHMDYTVQKAVELGVAIIVPLVTEFSNVRLDPERSEKKLAHWRAITIHACEQSGRTRLPKIINPMSFTDWVERISTDNKFILTPQSGKALKIFSSLKRDIVLLTGPEGGFSAHEITRAVAAGYEAITLGPRVLRTETAAVAALAAIQVLWGDLG
jgi:16S rRNA (uracil1498-N3)-methyltransferase